jgi:hypothetical protein
VPVQEYAAAGTRRCNIDIFRAGKKVARFNGRSAATMFAYVRPRPVQRLHLFKFLCATIRQNNCAAVRD